MDSAELHYHGYLHNAEPPDLMRLAQQSFPQLQLHDLHHVLQRLVELNLPCPEAIQSLIVLHEHSRYVLQTLQTYCGGNVAKPPHPESVEPIETTFDSHYRYLMRRFP